MKQTIFSPARGTNGHTKSSCRSVPKTLGFLAGGIFLAALFSTLVVACPIAPDSLAYVCENGAPISGTAPVANSVGCQTCNDGFELDGTAGVGSTCVQVYPYVCENGVPFPGTSRTARRRWLPELYYRRIRFRRYPHRGCRGSVCSRHVSIYVYQRYSSSC